MERRYFEIPDLEVRNGDDDDGFMARGHAATFMDPYPIADFLEQIDPRAFDEQLENPDVLALWNHNHDNVLGAVGSGTLRLSTDKVGLVSEIDFPESAHREREALRRGDVRKMSFGFRTIEEGWERRDDGTEVRTLKKVELIDVSPVGYPANPSTDISVAQRSRDEWHKAEESPEYAARARERRLSLAEHE